MRKWNIWKHYRNFFPIHLIKTCELSGEHNYIMGYHPHGILSAGAFCTFATEGTDWSAVSGNVMTEGTNFSAVSGNVMTEGTDWSAVSATA